MADADEVRNKVLSAASKLLRTAGPKALSNRRVAAEAGVTTMAIYSRFGGKGGVLESLYLEGVETLKAAQERVEGQDPVSEIVGLCHAYRETALAHGGHYRILFGAMPDWTPSESARGALFGAFARLQAAVQRAIDVGEVRGSAPTIAHALFAACHGHVMLSLNRYELPGAEDVYRQTVLRLLGVGPHA